MLATFIFCPQEAVQEQLPESEILSDDTGII